MSCIIPHTIAMYVESEANNIIEDDEENKELVPTPDGGDGTGNGTGNTQTVASEQGDGNGNGGAVDNTVNGGKQGAQEPTETQSLFQRQAQGNISQQSTPDTPPNVDVGTIDITSTPEQSGNSNASGNNPPTDQVTNATGNDVNAIAVSSGGTGLGMGVDASALLGVGGGGGGGRGDSERKDENKNDVQQDNHDANDWSGTVFTERGDDHIYHDHGNNWGDNTDSFKLNAKESSSKDTKGQDPSKAYSGGDRNTPSPSNPEPKDE